MNFLYGFLRQKFCNFFKIVTGPFSEISRRTSCPVISFQFCRLSLDFINNYNQIFDFQNKVLKDSRSLTEIEIFVGCVLCELLLITQNGSHGIKSSVVPRMAPGELVLSRQKNIGYTISPFKVFFRQSCDPNANVVNFKNYLYIYATQPIKEGQWVRNKRLLLFLRAVPYLM